MYSFLFRLQLIQDGILHLFKRFCRSCNNVFNREWMKQNVPVVMLAGVQQLKAQSFRLNPVRRLDDLPILIKHR